MSYGGDVDVETSGNPRTESTTAILVKQSNQLMNMLSKQQQTSRANQPNLAMMVGNICLLSHSNSKWLLDGGALDDFCYNLNQFSVYKMVNLPTLLYKTVVGSL